MSSNDNGIMTEAVLSFSYSKVTFSQNLLIYKTDVIELDLIISKVIYNCSLL